ncbi:hypothetical protein [Streptomyces clavifer]|uniref:hypothetical protein n=1 Tax=Streptomyces clavifer TaxID=68188 RepID=UPI00367BABF9
MTIGAFISPACAHAPPPARACALRTAQLREQVARIEAAAQDVEDYVRLLSRERSERHIARLLLAATPAGQDVQLDTVPLATIRKNSRSAGPPRASCAPPRSPSSKTATAPDA